MNNQGTNFDPMTGAPIIIKNKKRERKLIIITAAITTLIIAMLLGMFYFVGKVVAKQYMRQAESIVVQSYNIMNNNNLSLVDNDTAKDALEKNLSEISNKMYNNWTKYFLSRDDKCMLALSKAGYRISSYKYYMQNTSSAKEERKTNIEELKKIIDEHPMKDL